MGTKHACADGARQFDASKVVAERAVRNHESSWLHLKHFPQGSRMVARSVIAKGCLINRCEIRESTVGIRSIIGQGSQIHRTVMLGYDYYETVESSKTLRKGGPGSGSA